MLNVFKMSSFRCRSYVHELILPKNMFGCSLKFILNFFAFLAINQNIETQLCMHVKNHHCHVNYFKLDQSFSHLNLFQVSVICIKQPQVQNSQSLFSFFWNTNLEQAHFVLVYFTMISPFRHLTTIFPQKKFGSMNF